MSITKSHQRRDNYIEIHIIKYKLLKFIYVKRHITKELIDKSINE